MHGGMLTGHTWDMVALGLVRNWRPIAIDLRGHGDSFWAEDYTITAHVQDIVDFVENLELGLTYFVGMSLGGNVAGNLAFTRPDIVKGLCFVDIAPGFVDPGFSSVIGFMDKVYSMTNLEDVVEAAHKISRNKDIELLRYRYRTLMRQTAKGWAFKQDRREELDLDHFIAMREKLTTLRINVPVLIMRGKKSRILTPERAETFAAQFADGRVVTIPNAGHNVQEDNPKGLIKVLRAHLG